MTATRIECRGELASALHNATIEGERIAVAPVVSKLPGSPETGGGAEWCLFVSATGTAAEVLGGCAPVDAVRVAGEVRAAKCIPSVDGASFAVVLEIHAETVERHATRH